jgi:hypothetical protein
VALLFKPTHHTRGGIQTKGTAAAQQNGVYLLHRVAWVQYISFSRPGCCAAHIDTGDASTWREYHCATCGATCVSVVSHLNASNCRERIVVVHDLLSIV